MNRYPPMNPPNLAIALTGQEARAVSDRRISRQLDGSFEFEKGEQKSILHLEVPEPTPMLLYVSIPPADNTEYADPTMTGGIYDSEGHAVTFLATLKVGGQNSLLAYSFDVAMGRVYRVALAASSLTMTGRFIAVPHARDDRSLTSQTLNMPKELPGFLTPDAPPLEDKEKYPHPRKLVPRAVPVRIVTVGMRGVAAPNVLPHLTRRVQVTLDGKKRTEIPIAWGATHVRVLGSQRSRFFFLAVRSHGKGELVGPLQLQKEPFEIAHNTAALVIKNENRHREDYEVVYYLGF